MNFKLNYKNFKISTKLNAYLIFLISSSFYLYEYILQVAPGVMSEHMMEAFQINAAGFGIVSAFYFYAYAPMQLPAGLLFDRYGPRKLMTIALLVCSVGSICFASTDHLFTAALGRLLIGMASAFSFIGILVLISRWFPPRQFAFLAGLAQAMSSVGAIFGETPLAALVEHLGWRPASFILAFIGVLLAITVWFIVRDFPNQENPQVTKKREWRSELKRLLEVCKHSFTWLIAAYAFTVWAPIVIFAALWGVPYLVTKYSISTLLASWMCSMVWIGIAVGSPLLGWFSDYMCNRRLSLFLSSLIGLASAIALLYIPNLSLSWMYFVLFMFGVGAGGQTVSFAVIAEQNPLELVGTASGFNNMAVLLGGAIFQPIVGLVLHHNAGASDIGSPLYSVDNYNKALVVLPICFFFSLIAVFFIKESHPRKQFDSSKKLNNRQVSRNTKEYMA